MTCRCPQIATWHAVAGAVVVFACAACSSDTAPKGFCTAAQSSAVEVGVHDSISDADLVDSASGTLSTSSLQDSLRHIPGDSVLIGGDQLGTYTVTVHHPSYADWIKSGVVVSRTGPCGNVIPVELTARLVRVP